MLTRSVRFLGVCLFAVALSTPVWCLEEIDPGVYKVDFAAVDELLDLPSNPAVRVLILEDAQPKSVSDSHAKRTQQWVESGGVLWVAGKGLKGAIASSIAPFRFERYKYVKTSTDKAGGELIVKGTTPRLVIHDHELTAGVERLYVYPHFRFDGTSDALPLVSMTDTKGNTGLLLAAIRVGKGFVVLDGTARTKGRMFRRMPGMNAKYPNSVKQDTKWNSYDWEKFLANMAAHGGPAL